MSALGQKRPLGPILAQWLLLGATSTGQRNIYTLALEREMLKMKQRQRIYYSDSDRALMWERCHAGDAMPVIARLFDR